MSDSRPIPAVGATRRTSAGLLPWIDSKHWIIHLNGAGRLKADHRTLLTHMLLAPPKEPMSGSAS